MNDIFTFPIAVLLEMFRRHRQLAISCGILFFTASASLFILFLMSPNWYSGQVLNDERTSLGFAAAGCFFISVISAASLTNIQIKGSVELGGFSYELNSLREEREQIQHRVQEKERSDIFDTLQLSLNQLNEYYTINKSQARNSFLASVFAIIVGFLVIVGGIILYYTATQKGLQISAITGLAGAVCEFIGASYFYLYRTSLAQLNIFFAELVRTQDTMLAIKLTEALTPEAKRVSATERVVAALLERRAIVAPNGNPTVSKENTAQSGAGEFRFGTRDAAKKPSRRN